MAGKPKEVKYEINENGCHICTSHVLDKDGYPKLKREGRKWVMSRYVYTKNYGEIPEDMIVRHKCDNPTCINPMHLEIGTFSDNRMDAFKRGRATVPKGENCNLTKYSKDLVLEIYKCPLRRSKIAEVYNVKRKYVDLIKTKKIWKHILDDLPN
jgi:HNH endonuclease